MSQYGPAQCATNLAACPRVEKNARTDTIEFIFHKDKPKDRKATYVRSVCDIRTLKKESTEQGSLHEEIS